MNISKTRRGRLFWFLAAVVILAGFVFSLTAAPAQATGTPEAEWAKWELNVTFDNSTIQPQWTVLVGYEDVILDSQVMAIPCTAYGGVVVSGGQATFNGAGYYRCVTGSFKNVVFNMTGKILPNVCVSNKPDAWAKMVGLPDLAVSPNNPVFYQPDMALSYTIIDGTGGITPTMALKAGSMETSHPFPAVPGEITLGARLNDCYGSYCKAKYWANGLFLGQELVPRASLAMPTDPLVIYIGFDGSEYYQGSLTEGTLDPGCSGIPVGD